MEKWGVFEAVVNGKKDGNTWNMTITPAGLRCGATRVELPGNQYMAIRVRRV